VGQFENWPQTNANERESETSWHNPETDLKLLLFACLLIRVYPRQSAAKCNPLTKFETDPSTQAPGVFVTKIQL
jgi:hypothetical protein